MLFYTYFSSCFCRSDCRVLDPGYRYNKENMPEDEIEFNNKVKVLRDLEIQEKNITSSMRKTRHDDATIQSLSYFVTEDVQQYFTTEEVDVHAEAEKERLRLLQLELDNNVTTDWSVEAVIDEDHL